MVELVQRAVAWLMNRVRVNRVEEGVRGGAPVFVKRRRAAAPIIVWFANRFLALADSGGCMFVRAHEWIAWEIHCARLLYPERPDVTVGDGPAVIIPKAGGISLRALLRRNDSDPTTAFTLAAREVRRAHQIQCSYFNGAWSHGDLHLDNIISDTAAQRAVLIDFDTRHEPRNSATQRHADDLKVLFLELIGLSNDRWRSLATTFIAEYRNHSVLRELDRQLSVPRGFGRLLWYARTQSAPIEPRLQALREIIHDATGREDS
jgi:tRNA A-37 threonylcarbamoyl transferase component Bud32